MGAGVVQDLRLGLVGGDVVGDLHRDDVAAKRVIERTYASTSRAKTCEKKRPQRCASGGCKRQRNSK